MTRAAVALTLCAGVAACHPECRSQAFFEAHPGLIAQVLANCRKVGGDSPECVHALAADASTRRAVRKSRYRQSF